MIRTIIKTIVRDDDERRVQIFARDDGLFGFCEDYATKTLDGDPAWSPVSPSPAPICDTAETAEREARAQIGWLSTSR